jgi:hypothetical protein
MSRFDSRSYQIFWEVVGLERGPLSLVSTVEELLGRKSSCSGLEKWKYRRGDPSGWPRGTLYPQEVCTSFADRRRSLGWDSSLADSFHGVYLQVELAKTIWRFSSYLGLCFSFNAPSWLSPHLKTCHVLWSRFVRPGFYNWISCRLSFSSLCCSYISAAL